WTGMLGNRLEILLRYVGFDLFSGPDRIKVIAEGPGWAHVQAKMSAHGLSPVPQFGSQARGRYDIVCVGERPGVDVLSARLRGLHLDGHPVIVVYLGQLPMPQRQALSRIARDRELP